MSIITDQITPRLKLGIPATMIVPIGLPSLKRS